MARIAVLLVGAALASPPVATLRDGQTRWFAPGSVKAGDVVACDARGGRLRAAIPAPQPAAASDEWSWSAGPGPEISVAVRPNGAVRVACGKSPAALDRPALPYVVGRNGLGLIRGADTLARVRSLYGRGVASARHGSCRVVWKALGLRATFAGCSPTAVLVGAAVTGAAWSTLDGVRIGDTVGRMLWDDQGARRVSARTWLLGGIGRARPPRLLAVVGASGTVVRLVVETVTG